MVDDPVRRLEEHARQAVPPIEPGFADRLESSLRSAHAQTQAPSRRGASGWLPRLGVAFALIAVGVIGAFALTARDDAGVPVAVIDEDPSPDAGLAVESPIGAADAAPSPIATVAPTTIATPTPTATSSSASTSAEVLPPALVDPTSTSVPTPTPDSHQSVGPNEVVPTVLEEPEPAATTTPSTTAAPTATVTVERATPRPVPSPTPTVPQRPTSVPTPTSTPMVVREPAPIDLSCMTRVSGDAVGVICTWEPPIATDRAAGYGDIAHYELWRSRNSGEATVVVRTRPAVSNHMDRDVTLGDRVSYVVRGLDSSDEVIAASTREVVMVTGRG